MLQVPLEPPQLPEFRHPPSFPGGRRIRRTSTSPKDVSSSAILSVPQIPQPHSVLQTLPDSPAATTIKSPLIQGKNTATILKEEIGSAASVQNVAIPKSTEWSRREDDDNAPPQRGTSDWDPKHANTRNGVSGTTFGQPILQSRVAIRQTTYINGRERTPRPLR